MIKIENLSKSFGEKKLFEGLNETIEDGSFVVVSGKSGCGKSTFLNILGNLEKHDTGRILIDDEEIEKIGHARYLRDYVSFLFQNFALIENKTVKQNLSIIKKKNRSGISIKEALERVGMLDKLNTKVYKLSGGEQQRVALARVLLKKSKIVLADEPTGSLDEENARIVIDILKKLSEEGKTVIMVSHNKDYLKEASKVIYL
ncbi:ABC transporter ATP-binding protein [Lachnospira pectinoschiza]|uniref:Putative ABC transport system ATP-binding protein n=1 Tax=Lachnospira pectinoschiza TaxID=28052 RepID=A0A1G9T341_9FIRM|nr:putative ABC transport system ATP-binding protein [Lachnospira pectinoschiza]